MATSILVIVRVVLGVFFIVSGFEKLIGPYQNFLYIVQSYEIFGTFLENIAARLVPWIELFFGIFLVVGLWVKWILRGLLILIALFIGIVAQALIRNLPIIECGCFGSLISLPLHGTLILDCILLFLTGLLLAKEVLTSAFSLDRYFGE